MQRRSARTRLRGVHSQKTRLRAITWRTLSCSCYSAAQHEQAPLHGWVALQRPLQTPITPGCFCNCRAETVPAQRTVITRAAKSVALIFLPMIALLSNKKASRCRSIRFQLFFRRSERPWVSNAPTGGSSKDLADASAAARLVGATCAFARRKQVGRRPQLPGGNRTRAQNSRGNCCKERIFKCLAHDSLFLSITSRRNEYGPAILPAWLPPTGTYLSFLRKK
jgi:hypothetical protein